MDSDGWIDMGVSKPTEADADAQNCILAWHRYNGPMVIGWWQYRCNSLLTHWRALPDPPMEYRETWAKKEAVSAGTDAASR